LAAALGSYRLTVIPALRREQRLWGEAAGGIPDPELRRQALSALEDKALNVEAIGVFATLAPRPQRRRVILAMAALQIAIDFIDTLGESSGVHPPEGTLGESSRVHRLEDGLALHRALVVALSPGAPPENWYRHHPRDEDGGYLSSLVAACQEAVHALPAQAAILPFARRAAERCGEGQSHTHADPSSLEGWAAQLDTPPDYRWWEVAAGASSSVAAHALIAAAAHPATARPAAAGPAATADEAELIDAAYHPPIGALTVLLDDLIDRDEDAAAGEHNYMDYYSSAGEAADRLALIAARASAATAKLPQRRRHAAILTGVAAFYLSAAEVRSPFARSIRNRLLDSLGPTTRPLAALLRLQRRA
jgi:tetraprenyl-beta-curcumene synthase